MRRALPATAISTILLVACGASVDTLDKVVDGGEPITDGSAPTDAGPLSDASPRDAGPPRDGGLDRDAGAIRDSGPIRDGGDVAMDLPDPVLFIHGISGSSADFDLMKSRFIRDGWPADRLFAIDFDDPQWGCNVDNASTIQAEVARIQNVTGAARIDLVAHSMGTLSSRHYVKVLGGMSDVNTYVTLGGLHHGNRLSCLNPLDVCVWQELCPTKVFLMTLNADPATPGNLAWVSIYSTDDGTVPVESSELDGAENIEVMGVPHAGTGGLTEDEGVYQHVKRVLEYPAW